MAKYHHDTQIDKLKSYNAVAARWYASAIDLADRNDTLVRQLLQDGMKHVLLLHGATAIACLNALFLANSGPYKPAMKFGMVGALLGIALLAGGTTLFMNTLSTQNGRIRGTLNNKTSLNAVKLIYRWSDMKLGTRIRLAGRLINASILWFCLYITICLLLILDA